MEDALNLIGQGRTKDEAAIDLSSKLLVLAEEVGVIGFSNTTYTISSLTAASTGTTTIEF